MEKYLQIFRVICLGLFSFGTHAATHEALILNSTGHSMSVVNLTTNSVRNLTIGPKNRCLSPNHISQLGAYLYVTCSLSDVVIILEDNNLKAVRAIDLKKSSNPMETAIISTQLAAATSFTKNSLLLFDPRPEPLDKERILKSISLGTSPNVQARPSGIVNVNDILFVALANLDENYKPAHGGEVAVIRSTTGETVKTLRLRGQNTTHLAYSPQVPGLEKVIFALSTGDYGKSNALGSGYLSLINSDTLEVDFEVELGQAPTRLSLSGDGVAYFSNAMGPSISRYDVKQRQTMSPLTVSPNQCQVATPTDFRYISDIKVVGDELWALEFTTQCFFRLNRLTGEILSETKVGEGPIMLWPR